MRILVVGDFVWYFYQEACCRALEHLGLEVERFAWRDVFWSGLDSDTPKFRSVSHQVQHRLRRGPLIKQIQLQLLNLAEGNSFDFIWLYNALIIEPETIRMLRTSSPKSKLVLFTPDNAFAAGAKPEIWKNFRSTIPLADIHLSVRESDRYNFVQCGAKTTFLLPQYFVPEDDYPVPLSETPEDLRSDVVFVGHFENDCRLPVLDRMTSEGLSVKVFGTGWPSGRRSMARHPVIRSNPDIRPMRGDKYREAITASRIALCFFSKLNGDSYTRRNFQIPAMRVPVLSEHSDPLSRLFAVDKEILMFREPHEAYLQVEKALRDNDQLDSIAKSALDRVHKDGHDVVSRMALLTSLLESLA